MLYDLNTARVLKLKSNNSTNRNVLYYTIRDLRLHDNWAVVHSQNIADILESKMYIVFSVLDNFLDASIRQYSFLKEGLVELETDCKKFNICFQLLYGNPTDTLKIFIEKYKIGYLIIEQFPLKIFKRMVEKFKSFDVNIHQVDAHNIIPVWVSSDKREYNARTLRIKIKKLKNDFLTDFPIIKKLKQKPEFVKNDFDSFLSYVKMNKNVPQIVNKKDFKGGQSHGMLHLFSFLKKIDGYENRNDANSNSTSRLSFWLHFGMVSSQRCVLEAEKLYCNSAVLQFVEEIFVRKELSDNFCYYVEDYTSIRSCYEWAQNSLRIHETDERENLFSLEELENQQTNDKLWNACQLHAAKFGYLNGYLRMYWAKKVLEWSNNAQEAVDKLVILNDRYFIDGRDPNGYVGILWSVAGLHDRAFGERKIYGKIRFMSLRGLKKHLNINTFIENLN